MEVVYLTRRNLETLLSKLDRQKEGELTMCTVIKRDPTHPKYPQSMPQIAVVALEEDDPDLKQSMAEIEVVGVEDGDYYTHRNAGPMNPADEERIAKKADRDS